MTLHNQFVAYFKGFEEITTADIFKWYKEVRSGSSKHTYHSNIYNIVIYPMVARGTISRVRRGVYTLQPTPSMPKDNIQSDIDITVDPSQWDEWDHYINDKLKEET